MGATGPRRAPYAGAVHQAHRANALHAEWELGRCSRAGTAAGMWEGLRDALRDTLRDRLRDRLRDALRDALRDTLRNTLRDTLWKTLRDTLRDTPRDYGRFGFRTSLNHAHDLFAAYIKIIFDRVVARSPP